MNPFAAFGLAYLLVPVLTIAALVFFNLQKTLLREQATVHLGLLIASSIALAAAPDFPLAPTLAGLAVFLVAALVLYWRLGSYGAFYAGSALLQELTMLSAAWLLLPALPLWGVWLLIVPIYSFTHLLERRKWEIRTTATLAWGTASLLLFATTGAWILSAALHGLLGGELIRREVFHLDYPAPEKTR